MIPTDTNLIAVCGVYCGACKSYLKGKCPGCKENQKASWCKTRTCCLENNYLSCADCTDFDDPMDCKKYNTIFSKIFAFIFRSNRPACIQFIKEKGYDEFAREMADKQLIFIKK